MGLLSLIVRRNRGFLLRIWATSLLLFLFIAWTAVGAAVLEKFTLQQELQQKSSDFELAGPLNPTLQETSLEPFFQIGAAFRPRTTEWLTQTQKDHLLLLVHVPQVPQPLFVGFSLLPHTNQSSFKTASLTLSQFNFAGTVINTAKFLNQTTLPFGLDLLLSKHDLEEAHLTSLILDLNDAQIGYTIDFKPHILPSFQAYKQLTERIETAFRIFSFEQELTSQFTVSVTALTFTRLDEFQPSFRSLTMLISLITMLTTIWFIQLLTQSYLKGISSLIERLRTQGLAPNQIKQLTFWLPASVDTLALSTLFLSFKFISTIYPLELTRAAIFALVCYGFMLYARSTQTQFRHSRVDRPLFAPMIPRQLARYLFLLFLASLYTLVLQTTIEAIIPAEIYSLLTLFVITAQYYALTLLLTHLGLWVLQRRTRHQALDTPHLLRKLLLGHKTTLTTWIHSMVLLTWAVTIIWASTHSFTTNYALHQEMATPTDLHIQVRELTLHNISTLETLPEIQAIIPLSHSQETFFEPYDLYLLDLPKLHTLRPDFFSQTDISQVLPNHAYMTSNMAKSFNFQQGDLFPIKFGYNQTTAIIEQQPIIITNYFPLIKPLDNRPFVVTSYLPQYENITMVNELFITLKDDIGAPATLTTLKQVLGSHFLTQTPPSIPFPYGSITRLYQGFFLVYALINSALSFHRFTQDLAPSLQTIGARGMTSRDLNRSLTRALVPIIVATFMASLLLGGLYVVFQLPRAIFPIPLYTTVQVQLGLAILISALIPCSILGLLRIKSPASTK